MTNRLSKWSRHSTRMACLLAACGLMYACTDEFILDDEKPSWLNSSIYERLELEGNYKTYLKLLADKDVNREGERPLTDVLGRTGSKTVFVANDSAWDAFFAANAKLPESNPWHYATSYENLSQSQKKLLVHTSMLNNAIVMENLASSETSNNSSPVRGEYMRRYTDVLVTDSITYLSSKDLPQSYNYYYDGGTDKDYWERFREIRGGKGIWLANDSTVPMMLHFTAEHMSRNNFKEKGPDDFEKIMGYPRSTSDVHIYDALLKQKDAVCENGYVNVTGKPLCPLPNMAEIIRTNGKTNIFSHILDRFSAPFYCEAITQAYKDIRPGFSDSIFIKRYFSENNYSTKGGYTSSPPLFEPGDNPAIKLYQVYDPYKTTEKPDMPGGLLFDPGWNGYYDEVDVRKDMAAIFVPNDAEMWHYFTKGGGQRLLKVHYAKEGTPEAFDWVPPAEGDTEELFRQIDCIPLGTINSLINNFMQRSFVNSIPSKWGKLTDDAQEPLFEDVDVAREMDLDTCLLASNGAIYVMNRTCVPADYRSITTPAFISNISKIMKSAIYAGYEGNPDYMSLNYYAYLKAMQSRFTFLLPTDNALRYYYDPASMKSRTPRVVEFSFIGGSFPVKVKLYKYNSPYSGSTEVGTIGNALPGTTKVENDEIKNRLKDILESHTIVHDGTNPMAHMSTNKKLPTQEYYGIPTTDPLPDYYLSKNGNPVKAIRDTEDNIIGFKGGFQIENERMGIVGTAPGITDCGITEPNEADNGYTFVIDAPLVPTYRSVYSIFTNDFDQVKNNIPGVGGETIYSEFYNLCTADAYDNEIIGCGLVDERVLTTQKQRESALKKFRIFIDDKGLDFNVQFFNNYRYTIFVPTNAAVQSAIAAGLPTWEEIYEDYHSHCKPEMVESPVVDEKGNPVLDEDNNPKYEWIVKTDNDGEIVYTDSLCTTADSVRIAAKITYLTNFVRYHFADNSVFADRTELAPNEMVTSSYDKEIELFCKIHVDRINNGHGADLRVCDDVSWKKNGNSMAGAFTTIAEIDGKDVRNILARDLSCSKAPTGTSMQGITINSSSAAVIHSIDGYLNHVALDADNRHDGTWKNIQSARKYLQRYAIKDIH